ncbi:prepilin-type N-terminal cleavage/methylation domain-containing protein [Polynucleobacter necessarius]|uniref:prepilin-type N-terminal cleavage/methylation domain-containing protein n=1 Tax=Polynucleobacter necessarius TaxID=576610 RepID=UPI001E338CB3|nr:prepilin-type N-terminal cleavage/methylation domain-containing protein [Polynucleobacter necessarius]
MNNKWLPQKEKGSTLLELMAVVLIIAITATMSLPLLQEQIAAREMDAAAR